MCLQPLIFPLSSLILIEKILKLPSVFAAFASEQGVGLGRLQLQKRFKTDPQGYAIVIVGHCSSPHVAREQLMLKLRGQLCLEHLIEMLKLVSSALKKLVNVDVLWDSGACLN
jgi:hypothetical protein